MGSHRTPLSAPRPPRRPIGACQARCGERHPLPQQDRRPMAEATQKLSTLADRLRPLSGVERAWGMGGGARRVECFASKKSDKAATPSYAIIDSQSVKTVLPSEERGIDGGKKVKGRKRHIVVDTLGNLIQVIVHAAHAPSQCRGPNPRTARIEELQWRSDPAAQRLT